MIICQIKYILYTQAAIFPHRQLRSPDSTMWQQVPANFDHWSCRSYPYVYPGSFFASLVGYFPIVRIDQYMYLLIVRFVCSKWSSPYPCMYTLQKSRRENCHQPSCPRNALLQLQQETNTLVSPHRWSETYMAISRNYALSSWRRFSPSLPIANDAQTPLLVSKLIVRTYIESLGSVILRSCSLNNDTGKCQKSLALLLAFGGHPLKRSES